MNGYGIKIKPLSVNKAWKGRRFKTDTYKKYERDVILLLPKIEVPEGKLCVHLEFGFSNKQSDADNPVKLFIDILQKKYGFNDNKIYSYVINKADTVKGAEYIMFNITALNEG